MSKEDCEKARKKIDKHYLTLPFRVSVVNISKEDNAKKLWDKLGNLH